MLRLFQNLFASTSLERKCLLLFGSVVLVLMCMAFWLVQLLTNKLVIQRTRQIARDYSFGVVERIHADAILREVTDQGVYEEKRETLDGIGEALLNKDYRAKVLSLPAAVEYQSLPALAAPESAEELRLLKQLEIEYRQHLAERIKLDRPDIYRPLDLGVDAPMSQFGPNTNIAFEERYPVKNENGEDEYIHYTPVFSKPACILSCHRPSVGSLPLDASQSPEEQAAQYPFRVVRVSMPYRTTVETAASIRSILIATAMLIITVMLFILHAIVRYLVLDPLHHLRDVSDAITRGETAQRAVIESEDEFRELGDAFNRMLRHMTETQDQLQTVNGELDSRVDQLAQANLQLYQANRLKSDFLANMSHELRTPLNSIIGFSEVLQGIESLSDKQRRYASNIRNSGRILLDMINDILDLAKVEAGKMELRPVQFDVGRLVSAQADMVRSLSEDKNISLTVEVEEEMPEVYQDQNKLGQVLNNLLSNAIKFTPEGGLITVRVSRDKDDEEHFKISIADTGVGIAAEDQSVIFEKFRQSKKVLDGEGLTREYAGTGLGLSIVKELTKLLGGQVGFESELGHGSTFWITLPWHFDASRKITDAASAASPVVV
ncbi:MAG: sensor histidine kinase [Planctomycetaceae bacterium]